MGWALEVFSMGETTVHFSMGLNSKFSCYPLESTRTTFFATNLIGKCQISKSKEANVLLSDAHAPLYNNF